MAKKKAHKKHNFKYAQAKPAGSMSDVSASSFETSDSGTKTKSSVRPAASVATVRSTALTENPYLGRDLARIGILAAVLLGLQVVLWLIFGHTGLGSTIYNLYKVSN